MNLRYLIREEKKIINDTANVALKQIYEKHYKEELVKKGVSENNIYCYGVAFQGKLVAISKEIEGI